MTSKMRLDAQDEKANSTRKRPPRERHAVRNARKPGMKDDGCTISVRDARRARPYVFPEGYDD